MVSIAGKLKARIQTRIFQRREAKKPPSPRLIKGPIPPGADVGIFRETGVTTPTTPTRVGGVAPTTTPTKLKEKPSFIPVSAMVTPEEKPISSFLKTIPTTIKTIIDDKTKVKALFPSIKKSQIQTQKQIAFIKKELFTEEQLRSLIEEGRRIKSKFPSIRKNIDKRLEKLIEKRGRTPKEKEELTKLIKIKEKIEKGAETIQEEIFIGAVPRTPGEIGVTIASLGIGAVLGAGAKGIVALGKALKIGKIGKVAFASKLLNKVPKSVIKKGGVVLVRGLEGAYLVSSGLRVAKEPTGEKKLQKVGQILSQEVIPFKVGSRLGVKGVLRNELKEEIRNEVKKLPAKKRESFKQYMNQAELLGKYEPEARNIKLNNIESIPNKKAQAEIRKFLKSNKNEVVVGGSVAQTGQIKVGRKLGDMDLYLEGKLTPSQASKILEQRLKNAGVERVSRVKGQVTIAGKKAIEFHDIERLLVNIKQVIPIWQNPRRYIIKTPEGIPIQRVGLQIRRKVVASFADPKRLATGKYKKDLKDFKSIADELFKNAEKKARLKFFFKEKDISKVRKGLKKPKLIESELKTLKKFEKKIEDIKLKPKLKKKPTPSQKKLETPSQPSQPFVKPVVKKLVPSQPFVKPPTKPTPPTVFKAPPTLKAPIPPRIIPSQPPTKPLTKKAPTPFIKAPPIFKPSKPSRKIPHRKRIIKKGVITKVFKQPVRKREGFVPQSKDKGIWHDLTKRPLRSKQQAVNLARHVTDRTTSAQLRILQRKNVKKFGKPSFKTAPQKHFRNFKIRKGKRIPLKNSGEIEKRKFRISNLSEQKQLSVARFLKQKQQGLFPKVKKFKFKTGSKK